MGLGRLVRYLFNPWVIGGAIAFSGVLACITFSALWITRPATTAFAPATAVLNIIPVPTSTPVINTPIPTIAPQPTGDVPPAPGPGLIITGDSVQISGTGGDGLRLRSEPGLNGVVNFLAYEGEIFKVSEGPKESDGYTWWYLVAPYDESVQGWAVSNYLLIVQNP
ncbi:MAG: hypothetical protein A2W33_02445 [Chloroflexi bacterium RBG_16_52_11]|nr:MAG: hypothetical protein A2W33_02445 [Chloroflexi bacterium RBG_16_52_11]